MKKPTEIYNITLVRSSESDGITRGRLTFTSGEAEWQIDTLEPPVSGAFALLALPAGVYKIRYRFIDRAGESRMVLKRAPARPYFELFGIEKAEAIDPALLLDPRTGHAFILLGKESEGRFLPNPLTSALMDELAFAQFKNKTITITINNNETNL